MEDDKVGDIGEDDDDDGDDDVVVTDPNSNRVAAHWCRMRGNRVRMMQRNRN